MTQLRRQLLRELSSPTFDLALARSACFIAAPAIVVLGARGVSQLAATPGEALIGSLAALTLALGMVILGFVLPRPESAGWPAPAPQ